MSERLQQEGASLSIAAAVEAFFDEFDFGEGGEQTRRSYRSGASAFLRFAKEDSALSPDTPIETLPSSVPADFNAWMQSAEHSGLGLGRDDGELAVEQGYSAASGSGRAAYHSHRLFAIRLRPDGYNGQVAAELGFRIF